jgi:ubiquinone/menaquinone biosynthesis C-methylase UbiE
VSDSLTEYAYWRRRGKRHHAAGEVQALRDEALAGKRILEIGCGAGVNLLSLQRVAEVVGVDIEPEYLAFVELIARAEGVPAPRCICARAERLPFADESFDVTLFPGSLPYMRIERALSEAARVLRPGGRAIAVLSDFGQMLEHRARRRKWSMFSPGVLFREARSVAGTIAYPWLGRSILKPMEAVHPTQRRTRSWFASAGLRFNARETFTGPDEVCYVADKPAASVATVHPVPVGAA